MKRRLLAVAIALLMIITIIPAVHSESVGTCEVPTGYNETDYYAALAFLETENENGIKNGKQIREDYDPEDPETWWYIDEDEFIWGFYWFDNGNEKILTTIDLYHMDVVGTIDMSQCVNLDTFVVLYTQISEIIVPDTVQPLTLSASYNTMLYNVDTSRCLSNLVIVFLHGNPNIINLDFSMNMGLNSLYADNNENMSNLLLPKTEALQMVDCYNSNLSSLDLSGCSQLRFLQCQNCYLEELNVSNCPVLMNLNCSNNKLTALDISANSLLFCLDCSGNEIDELDFSNNNNIQINGIIAQGDGSISCKTLQPPFFFENDITYTAYAQPCSGEEFLGWFSEDGEMLSADTEFDYSGILGQNILLIARFTGGEAPVLPGDVDGNGEVMVSDAIMALRAAMGILELSDEQFEAADMNANGSVEVADAVTILRVAMGLMD